MFAGKKELANPPFAKKAAPDIKTGSVFGPVIIKPLSSTRAESGKRVNLECVFSGHPKPSAQWFYNDTEISPDVTGMPQFYVTAEHSYDDRFSVDQPEVFNAQLSIDKAKINDIGVYKFTAINEGGSATTSANLIVVDADANAKGWVTAIGVHEL